MVRDEYYEPPSQSVNIACPKEYAMAVKQAISNGKKCFKCGDDGHVARDCDTKCITPQEMEQFLTLKQKFGHTLKKGKGGKGDKCRANMAYMCEDYSAGDMDDSDHDNYHTTCMTWEEVCAMKKEEEDYNIDTSGSEG